MDSISTYRTRMLRRIAAAGMTAVVVTRDDQLCAGGREPVPRGANAAQDADGWVYCWGHIPEPGQS